MDTHVDAHTYTRVCVRARVRVCMSAYASWRVLTCVCMHVRIHPPTHTTLDKTSDLTSANRHTAPARASAAEHLQHRDTDTSSPRHSAKPAAPRLSAPMSVETPQQPPNISSPPLSLPPPAPLNHPHPQYALQNGARAIQRQRAARQT